MPWSSSRRRFLKQAAYTGGGVLIGAAGLNEISPWIWRERLAFEPNHSYWARSAGPRSPRLASDLDVDVAIVGGGFTGLSSAFYIRGISAQKSVAVFEAQGCGSGASGRNGAMVLTMTADRFMNFSSSPAMDREIYDLTADNIRRLAALSLATGIDCELTTNGALQVFESTQETKAAEAYVRQARSLGMPVEFWNRAQVAAAIGTTVYEGGFFDPRCGNVHPMKLVRVFKAAAMSAGATVYEDTVVESIEEGAQHVLHTRDGHTVRAKSLVLASNAFTSRLGYFRNSILPLREFIGVTRPFSEQELGDIGWQQRLPFNDDRTQVYYLGLTADRRIHIGGGAPQYSFNSDGGSPDAARLQVSRLQRELARLYPRLAGLEFETSWDGVIDWTLDASPSVGVTGRHRNIFHGLGYSGHGVNLTSVFGRIIADLEAGRGEAWNHYPFVNARLDYVPNEPFRWLAAESGLAWYRLTEGEVST
jgi:glycine/D-amino acid oxidase-like deaminating enzyme